MSYSAVSNAQQKVYYVNDLIDANDQFTTAAGNDANDGLSPATPFENIATAIALSQSGDRIMVDAGEYHLSNQTLPNGVKLSGTKGDKTKLIIKDGPLMMGTNTQLWNCRVERVIPNAPGFPSISVAISPGASNIQIENCYFFKNRTAIYVEPGTQNLTIKRNRFYDNRTGIIVPDGGSTTATNTKLYIYDNNINYNRSYGIIFTTGGTIPVEAYISNNNIVGNLASGIELGNSSSNNKIYLRNNYFGTTGTVNQHTVNTNGGFYVADHDGAGYTTPPLFFNNNIIPNLHYPYHISGGNTSAIQTGQFHTSDSMTSDATTNFVSSSNPPHNKFVSIQDAIDGSQVGATITVPDGVYSEDLNINKVVTISGTSVAGTVVKGVYDWGKTGNVVNIGAAATIQNLSITRDFGKSDESWKKSEKNQGVIFTANNAVVNNISVFGQRNGIYANDRQNITITNSTFEKNRTGVHLVNNISGAKVKNNFIKENFTHGIMLNADGNLNLTGVEINDNLIVDNWYSQFYFHQTNSGGNPVVTATTDLTRNAFGAVGVTENAVAMNEPGYTSQTVSYFSGASTGAGTTFAGNQIGVAAYPAPWREDLNDVEVTVPGFQPTNTFALVPVASATALNNDYRTIANAIGSAYSGATITLDGNFDWSETNALASWAKGNDNMLSTTADNYAATARTGLNNVQFKGINNASVAGPGDLPTANLEAFLSMSSGINKGWTISDLNIAGFDLSIYYGSNVSGGADSTIIKNNTISIPKDLIDDANQNIGIHLSNGKGIEVTNNTFLIDGTGVGNGTANSTSVALQSATTGGNLYDGLKINNNTIKVEGVPSTTYPSRVIGLWENSHNVNAAIELNNNIFENVATGNLAKNNQQLAFRVTSRSGANANVVYQNNEIAGFNRGVEWIGDPFTTYGPIDYAIGSLPVLVQNNKFDNVDYAVSVRKLSTSANTNSPAIITNNSFANIGQKAVNYEGNSGALDANCNWWGTTAYNFIQDSLIVAPNGGSIIANMILNDGTNTASIGFTPNPNTCEGIVQNITANSTHSTIQAAINAANDGDSIYVPAGVYTESVNVNKSVKLAGAKSTVDPRPSIGSTRSINGTDETVVKAAKNQRVFNITANNVKIEGFLIKQEGGSGTNDAVKSENPQTDLLIRNNIVVNATDEAIQLEAGNNILIEQNYTYKPTGEGVAVSSYNVTPLRGLNQIIRNNDIDSSSSAAGSIYLYGTKDVEISGNVIKTLSSGIALGSGGLPVNDINVHHNKISTELRTAFSSTAIGIGIDDKGNNIKIENNHITQSGTYTTPATTLSERIKYNMIRVGVDGSSNPSNVIIRENYLSRAANEHYIHVISSVTNEVNATCNWFSNTDLTIVPTLVSGTGAINYVPFLNDGTNTLATTLPGFEPTSNACFAPVHNITKNRDYLTIQSAIDAVSTTNGDTIVVDAGTYTENVNISKKLTLRAPNYLKKGNDVTRVVEAIIVGGVKVNHVDVTFEGFNVRAGSNERAIDMAKGSGVFIKNNIIDGLTTSTSNAIWYGGASGISTIEGNLIKDFTSGTNPWKIMFDGSATSEIYFTGNELSNMYSGMIFQASMQNSVGEIKNNILSSNAYPVIALGASSKKIIGNEITKGNIYITGHANPALNRGNNNLIANNVFTGTGNYINFENQPHTGNVIQENAFLRSSFYKINNAHATSTIIASCNWWDGTAEADVLGRLSGAGVSNITYNNWLVNGTDNDATTMGFQPVPNTCTGSSIVLATVTPKAETCGGANGSIALAWTGGTAPYVISWTGGNAPITTSNLSETISGLTQGMYVVTVKDANNSTVLSSNNTIEYQPVLNTNTNITYATIQAAINAATVNDVIEVCTGNYAENVNINKAIKLTSEAGMANTIIEPVSGNPITISAQGQHFNDILVNGFTLKSSGSANASGLISMSAVNDGYNVDGLTLKNLDIDANGQFGLALFDVKNAIIDSVSISNAGIGMEMIGMANLNIKNTTIDASTGKAINLGKVAGYEQNSNIAITKSSIVNGTNNVIAIDMSSVTGTLMLDSNNISNNAGYGFRIDNGPNDAALALDITNNKFENNGGVAVYLEDDNVLDLITATIKRNIFDGNRKALGVEEILSLNVTENIFRNTTQNAVEIFSNNVNLNNNSFKDNAQFSLRATVPVMATCNWWDGTAEADVTSKITGLSNVTYSNWLVNGTDNDATTMGFQPVPNTCTGTPIVLATVTPKAETCGGANGSIALEWTGGTAPYEVSWTGGNAPITTSNLSETISGLTQGMYVVTVKDANNSTVLSSNNTIEYQPVLNTNTSITYTTIQAAINAAAVNDVIEVCAGTYTETINVNKSITLNGPNAGTDPNTGTRVAEAILTNAAIKAQTTNSTVVIDGFKISNPGNFHGVDLTGAGEYVTATIQNNIFERYATTGGQNTHGIYLSNSSAPKTIKNNLFTGSSTFGSVGSHKTWRSGVWYNGGTVTIQDNVFDSCNTALNLDATLTPLTLEGNTFKQGSTAISLGGQPAGYYTVGANDFAASGLSTLVNNSGVNIDFRLDISAGSYGGTPFTNLDLNTLFAVDGKIYHRDRVYGTNTYRGLVYFVKDNIYINRSTNSIIQPAINYAAVNDTITAQDKTGSSTYNEYLTINKPLTLQGQSQAGVKLNGSSLTGNGSGIHINNGVENVTIQKLTIQGFKGNNSFAGIYANAANNNLNVNNVTIQNNTLAHGVYANGPVENVSITNSTINGNTGTTRGIVIWNGLKKNITIQDNTLNNNGICGIELQDGSATGVLIKGNNITGNDNAIGLIGLTSGAGLAKANIVENNSITANGRFGIEIKNPNGTGNDDDNEDGAIIVRNNKVTLGTNTDSRDIAGISVYRRGVMAPNVDIPTGVIVKGNTVTGFTQSSTSTGFGIVFEGTNHVVTNNIVTGNEVGIQVQSGHDPVSYNTNVDGEQSNVADLYFGRGNTPNSCGIFVDNNTDGTNAVAATYVLANASGGLVINTNTNKTYCSIQSAINDNATLAGHVIELGNGTFDEQVLVNKSITIKARTGETPKINFTGMVAGKSTLFDISKDNVVIDSIQFEVNLAKLNSAIIVADASIDNVTIKNNTITPSGLPTGSYALRNAVSVNYGSYRLANDGVDNVVFENNTIHPNTTDGAINSFRAGFSADGAGGIFRNNTITSVNQDIQVRYPNNGNITIVNNELNGGGVEVVDVEAGTGIITVDSNAFNGAWWIALNPSNPIANPMLRLKNNIPGKVTNVNGNTFEDIRWGVSLENYNNNNIIGNVFTPAANATEYRHITVNTKSLTSRPLSSLIRVAVSANIKDNMFYGNGNTASNGKALAFYNHWNDGGAQYGNFDVANNTFNSSIRNYIFIDTLNGLLTDNPIVANNYQEYSANGANNANSRTTTGYWTKDIIDGDNLYFVGGSTPKLYANMNNLEIYAALYSFIYDKVDNPNVGLVIFGKRPDVKPTVVLGNASFNNAQSKNFVVSVEEIVGASTTSPIFIQVTIPAGYAFESFNSTMTMSNVPGVGPIAVNNADWEEVVMPGASPSVKYFKAKVGVSLNLSMSNIGFTLTHTTATSLNLGFINALIFPDSTQTYDSNSANNSFSRSVSSN